MEILRLTVGKVGGGPGNGGGSAGGGGGLLAPKTKQFLLEFNFSKLILA